MFLILVVRQQQQSEALTIFRIIISHPLATVARMAMSLSKPSSRSIRGISMAVQKLWHHMTIPPADHFWSPSPLTTRLLYPEISALMHESPTSSTWPILRTPSIPSEPSFIRMLSPSLLKETRLKALHCRRSHSAPQRKKHPDWHFFSPAKARNGHKWALKLCLLSPPSLEPSES